MTTSERVSGSDRAWLLMERSTNLMMVIGLLTLSAPLRLEQLRELVAERFLAFERFRCIPATDAIGASWLPCEHFHVDDHVTRSTLPAGAGQHDLEALVSELASTPFNQGRPLWSFHLVAEYLGGSALIIRIHHCYADGIALMGVLVHLADGVPGRAPGSSVGHLAAAPHGNVLSGIERLAAGLLPQWLSPSVHDGAALIDKGVHYLLHPLEASAVAYQALGVATQLARIATLSDDPPTRLKQTLSGSRLAAWADPLSLEEVRTIGHVLGCTVNDVLVSSLAGAIGRYLESQGDTVQGLTIRAAVPVNLRTGAEPAPHLGNRFGLMFVELPIGIRHPLERLYAVHGAMQALKGSPQALATLAFIALLGQVPAVADPAVALFSAKASLVASNVPGPPERLELYGAPVSQILFWVPQSGSIGMGVSMFSYHGQVQFGVIVDRQLVPRPTELVDLIGTEFERLVFLVLLGGAPLVA